jgi:hypothetical protein
MIDINKKYRTRDGLEVRIYATDGTYPYPVHGAIRWSRGWVDKAWNNEGVAEGRALGDCNLVEVKPRHKRTVWINVYPNGQCSMWEDKHYADKLRDSSAIACIKVELDSEEGEGLNNE